MEKKILVLKQVTEGFSITDKAVSGIARFEQDLSVTTFHLSLINLCALDAGSYFCMIKTEQTTELIELGLRPLTFNKTLDKISSLTPPFSVALVFIKDDVPMVIAYASECEPILEFKKSLAEKCLLDRKRRAEQTARVKISETEYNDEALATENYFETDTSLQEKLEYIEKVDNDYFRNANALSSGKRQEKTEKEQKHNFSIQDEKFCDDSEVNAQANTFFSTARTEITTLLSTHEEEPSLSNIIPESKWVKIKYSSTKYYVVGLIKENGKEKYICYGVPAKYSAYPPSELAGYCSFIPLSVFNLKGDGYWMMFQDAITGECVKFNQGI